MATAARWQRLCIIVPWLLPGRKAGNDRKDSRRTPWWYRRIRCHQCPITSGLQRVRRQSGRRVLSITNETRRSNVDQPAWGVGLAPRLWISPCAACSSCRNRRATLTERWSTRTLTLFDAVDKGQKVQVNLARVNPWPRIGPFPPAAARRVSGIWPALVRDLPWVCQPDWSVGLAF